MEQIPEKDEIVIMKEKLEELERMHREIMHKLNHLVRAVDDIHRHFRKRAEKTHSD